MKAAFLLFLFGTAVAQIAPPDQKLFSSQAPVSVNMSDGANASYELGMRFTSTAAGQIKVIPFYKSAAETGSHTGKIFSSEDKLAAAPSPTPTPATAPAPAPDPSSCNGAPNTPGGPDAFGGCFPGPSNTGVPAATKLTTYNGNCDIRMDNVVLDSVTINCSLLIYAKNLTIRNSVVNGYIMTNAAGASVTVQDTTVNGADNYVGVVDGDNVTVIRSNISGGEHSVHCGSNCVVRDSYLHDQWDGTAAGWHQNGFLSNGGSNNTIVHNSVGCVGACTADIAFLLNDNQSHATVDKNLLLAAPNSAFCSYPGPVSTSKSAISGFMTWTNNVFQRGANKKCGFYGPIYDWVSQTTNPNKEGYQNVWSGNKWDDGRALNP